MFRGNVTPGGMWKALLATVVIAALLLTGVVFAVWRLGPGRPKPKGWGLQVKLRDMTIAMSAYVKDLGELPPVKDATDLARILASVTERGGRRCGPYMEFREKTPQKAALDPWSTPLLHERSTDGRSFRLGSAGPDRKFGTEDDIFVESPKPNKQKAGGEN